MDREEERARKQRPLDTILYEIDMLRHVNSTHQEKLKRATEEGSRAAICEYYLSIEGFLFHTRNLVGFFTNRKLPGADTDLIINEPEVWYQRAVDQRDYSGLIKRAREFDAEFTEEGRTCYDQISKFLLHCTTMRHLKLKTWKLEKMFERLDPILAEFKERFASQTVLTLAKPSSENATTATLEQMPWSGEKF